MLKVLITLLTLFQCLQAANIKDYYNELRIEKRSASNYKVETLPGLDAIPKGKLPEIYAGYIDVDTSIDKKYFFVRYNKTQKANDKLIFWYNGGPGCSSLDGGLLESGPLFVNSDEKLEYKAGTWLESADLVYVDQPAGTGFSVTNESDAELNDIADDMLVFFQNYFKEFPEDLNKDIYFGGESYAGQYIPYFAARVLTKAKDQYKLKGLIIIDGYIYPDVQNKAIMEFSKNNNLIDEKTFDSEKVQKSLTQCQEAIDSRAKKYSKIFQTLEETGEYVGKNGDDSNKVESDECNAILNDLLQMTLDKSASSDQQCINQYDFTLRDSYPDCGMNWPVEEAALAKFLNNKTTDADFNLGNNPPKWIECTDPPSEALVNHNSYPAFFKLPFILEHIPVMLMVGTHDIICNIQGMEDIVDMLTWGGASKPGFDNVAFSEYQVEGNSTIMGQTKYQRGLWLSTVYNASHMIPYDHPEASRALVDLFFKNQTVPDNGEALVAPSYAGY